VAGPGSGKTTVLVERFAWLISSGLSPSAILAITFTEKAATEIKTRLVARYHEDAARRREVERATVCTIHAFCNGLLQEHAVAAGIDPRFRVMDAREAGIAHAAAMEAVLNCLALERREEFRALADVWPADDPAAALRSIHEALRMAGGARQALRRLPVFDPEGELDSVAAAVRQMLEQSPPPATDPQRRRLDGGWDWLGRRAAAEPLAWLAQFAMDRKGLKPGHPVYEDLPRVKAMLEQARRSVVGSMFLSQRALAVEALIEFESEYTQAKRAASALDFEDLQELTLALLEKDSEIRRQTSERYDAILMDELQDTNPVQWRILNLVRRPGRFFAVGDVNQSIFGFRYAAPEQFEAFQQSVAEAGGEIDRLQHNYRSRPEILRAVEAITTRPSCPGVTPHQLISARDYPPGAGPFVEIQRIESDDDQAEALWIAHRLRELHGTLLVGDPPRPATFGDMAILARTKAPFEALESALQLAGIPCSMDRGKNFFLEQEILDLTNCLRVLANPADEIGLFGLLRSPLFGVSDDELLSIRRDKDKLAPPAALARIARLREFRGELPTDRILARFLDETGFLWVLDVKGLANVDKFLHLMRSLDEAGHVTLEAKLLFIEQQRDSGREPNAPQVEASDAVQILTVHSAKGLEFPVVVMAGMQRGSGGMTQPIGWSPGAGLGMSWRLPNTSENVQDPALAAHISETNRREDDEEDRLLYVGMTRAEELLILSWKDAKRPMSRWPAQVEGGLQIQWPGEGQSVQAGGLRVSRLNGVPERLAPVAVAKTQGTVVDTRPLPVSPESSASITVSALAAFVDCPRRYYLQHFIGWPQPERRSEGASPGGGKALGTEVHEYLGGLREEVSAEARALAQRFLDSDLGRRAAAAERVHREFDFLFDAGGTLLSGQIDLWFEERGRVILVDYKTDRNLDEDRLRGYEMQLRLYAAALGRELGRPVDEAWLFALRERVAHAVHPGTEEEGLAPLRELQSAERSLDFPLRTAPRCQWCPYYEEACPSVLG
jgi:ATP-dependent exoDNAse (exonuclease V) beta subunit